MEVVNVRAPEALVPEETPVPAAPAREPVADGSPVALYGILDVYRRYVVGWLGADHLIAETCRKQAITPEKLTLPADRGSAMTSKKVALPLADGRAAGRRAFHGQHVL